MFVCVMFVNPRLFSISVREGSDAFTEATLYNGSDKEEIRRAIPKFFIKDDLLNSPSPLSAVVYMFVETVKSFGISLLLCALKFHVIKFDMYRA